MEQQNAGSLSRREKGGNLATRRSFLTFHIKRKKCNRKKLSPNFTKRKSHSCCKYVGCIFFRCLVRVILLLGRRGRVTRVFSSSKKRASSTFRTHAQWVGTHMSFSDPQIQHAYVRIRAILLLASKVLASPTHGGRRPLTRH